MKIFGVGKNFLDHVKEFDGVVPEEPVIFTKPETALLKNNAPFYFPDFSENIHFEGEIVIKIKKEGKNISEEFAPKYYDQIGIGIDFTARDLQMKAKEKGLPWALAKGFNGSAPISEFVSINQFKNIHELNFSLSVNDTVKQQGNTRDMIFNFNQVIAHISKFCTLKTGDIIFTGTPAGVGPISIGETLKCYIEDQLYLTTEIK